MKFYDVDSEFTFGKYEGKTIREVFEKDPKYIDFCFNNIDEFYVSPAVLRELRDMDPKYALPAQADDMNDDVMESFLEDAEELGEFEENFKEEEEEFGWDDDLDLGAGDDFDDYQSYDEDDDY
jgi:broad specificity phosphatase PhoE